MGYFMEQTDSNFIIKKENFRDALNNLKAIFTPDKMPCIDYMQGIYSSHFSWVRTDIVLNSETLGEALEEIRYSPIFNDNGDIINVEFNGEKYGDEEIFFAALAPFVEKDSYISFEGEDGCKWTWYFNGKEVRKNHGKPNIDSDENDSNYFYRSAIVD